MQSRAALLAAAVDLFGRQGFRATTVEQVAQHAGLTKGAFYHHFSTKEDVLQVIHDGFIDDHLERQQRIAERFDKAHDRLFHLVRLLVFIVTEQQPEVHVFFVERRALDPQRFSDSYAKRDAVGRIYFDTVRLGVGNGEFREDLDVDVAAFGILGMGNWTHEWFRRGGRLTPADIAIAFGRQALMGVTARPRTVRALVERRLPDPDPIRS